MIFFFLWRLFFKLDGAKISIISLQCCVGFRQPMEWISYMNMHTSPPCWTAPFPSPPSRSSESTEPTSLCSFPLARCPMRAGVYVSMPFSRLAPPFPSHHRPSLGAQVHPLHLRLEDSGFSDGSPPTPCNLYSLCHLSPDLQGLGFRLSFI